MLSYMYCMNQGILGLQSRGGLALLGHLRADRRVQGQDLRRQEVRRACRRHQQKVEEGTQGLHKYIV